jgi:uncharacterized protein
MHRTAALSRGITSSKGALLLLAATLVWHPACADLFTASLAYQKGDYEQAFRLYRELAELGQPKAQFNLAVMYANGQGTRPSDINAYAWALLAQENGLDSAKSMVEQIRPRLAPGSEKIAEDIRAPYRPEVLDKRLMPNIREDAVADQLETQRCRPTKPFFPPYPVDAERRGIQGAVYVEFTEIPDGTSRMPRVIYAVPRGVFESAARQGVLRSKFGIAGAEGKPLQCTMFYNFVAAGQKEWEYEGLPKRVEKTLTEARSGDVRAQVLYAYMLVGLPQLKRPRREAVPWFLKAAQAGAPAAQYQIGYSLLKGWGCNCEEDKALEWLRKAAEADQPDAQVTLARYALRGTPRPEDLARARVWLERAAAQDHHEGKLYLAALLAAAPAKEMRDPNRALTLIQQVFKDEDDDPAAFEVRAAAQASTGMFADAVKSQRRAISMAERLSWDLTPLKERLARYESNQPWYGDLLVF